MTRSFSVYLDLVRFLAAFVVVLNHAPFPFESKPFIFSFGHEAVVVFFVLSGYVIAYVADTKEHTLKAYTISRMARIYSVVLPAIILTGLFDFLGFTLDPTAYAPGARAWDYIPIRVTASLLFLNQIWFTSIQLFSNVPYWSLGYEVWYYAGFALVTYIGGRRGWLLFFGLALLLGPKIVLLMPLWWGGVYLYRSKLLKRVSAGVGWAMLLLSVLGFLAYLHWDMGDRAKGFLLPFIGPEMTREFLSSKRFLADYFLGGCIAVHFIGLRAICERYREVPGLLAKPIRSLAGSTFTLYLLHRPLLLFYAALFSLETVSPGDYLFLLAVVVATAYGISLVTEQKKHVFKRWITIVFDALEEWMARLFGTHRGLVRLLLANCLWLFGPYRRYGQVDLAKVKRLVFVCQGNVCRSPFGHHLAQKRIGGLPVCSLGLGTVSGLPADSTAQAVARDFGLDLSAHKTTAFADFAVEPGDLYLVMEDRHLRTLRPLLNGQEVQVALLGLWCRPPLALLYDPHRLTRGYFSTCFSRIAQAVEGLRTALELRRSNT